MRPVLLGLAVAALVLLVTGGRILFLPLLFVPLGLSLLRGRRLTGRLAPVLTRVRR